MSSRSERSLADYVLRPRSVAIVGVSDDAAKAAARPLRFMRSSGFAGTVYAINAKRSQVQGERAWPNLRELPEVPDHAFILTNAEAAIAAVHDCAELGVPMATILANGFAESGPSGAARQQELLDVARAGGVRVLGPNSLGVVNLHNGLLLTGNAAFAERDIGRGDVMVASQSGSAIGAYLSRGHARGLGFAALVSVGSESDLSIGELCMATLDDPEIGAYALFLEALQHTEELAAFGVAASRAGKPVIVYRLGRSQQTAALAVTHTGALAGPDGESRAFLSACGFALVDNFEGLIETPALVQRVPVLAERRRPRIGIITSTGGGAAVVVEELATRGCPVTEPSQATFDALVAAGCPVTENLIVDLTLAGTTYDLVTSAIQILQRSGEFDLIVFVLGSSARFNPELAVSGVIDRAKGETPLAAFVLPEAPQALAALQHAGIPTFRTPESCGAAVQATFGRERPTIEPRYVSTKLDESDVVVLDEAASAGVVEAQSVEVVPHVLLDARALNGQVSLPFPYPVVLKACSNRLPHKADAGAVVLNVRDEQALREAAARIATSVRTYDATLEVTTFLVQPMLDAGVVDVLVGYRVSPKVGPIVMLAMGGLHTELYGDSTLHLAPVDADQVAAMIDEVRGLRVLSGYRGAPAGDVEALAAAITAMSRLVEDQPDVLEAEINPLRVWPKGHGVTALDALVRRRATGPS